MRVVLLATLAAACGAEGVVRRPGAPDTDGTLGETDLMADSDVEDTDRDDSDPLDSDTGLTTGCPPEMARVEAFCVDRFEAQLEGWDGSSWIPLSPFFRPAGRFRAVPAGGVVPQAYISADEADAACEEAGKRLCTSAEWLRTCRGSPARTYPYGDTYRSDACNDTYAGSHPVVDYFGTSEGVWTGAKMNDPGINQRAGTVTRGGEMSGCTSQDGVMDLHGNLHEWVADAEGTFRGGFYADAKINGVGCGYVTTAHSRPYHDYSTGFRCCADAR